jgi:hypothetical protein
MVHRLTLSITLDLTPNALPGATTLAYFCFLQGREIYNICGMLKRKHKSLNSNILHEHFSSPLTGINFRDTNKIGGEQKFSWIPLLQPKSQKYCSPFPELGYKTFRDPNLNGSVVR